MRLAFILPGNDDQPYGGYRITYEYANRLAQRGHEVTLLFPAVRRLRQPERRLAARVLTALWRLPGRATTSVTWFELDPTIRLVRPASLTRTALRSFDAVIATAWDTAEDLAICLPSGTAGCYLIQHDESWAGDTDRVIATWAAPLTRIVIARWLYELALARGQSPVHHIPNAISTTEFFARNRLEDRNPRSVAMLWHRLPFKASLVGVEALELARATEPGLCATLFGYEARPAELPTWMSYCQLPSRAELAALLNTSAIFLSPSRAEGWALPPAEAMACGAALVATDIGGHRDYARAGDNAMLVAVDDAAAMAEALVKLIRDDALRLRLGRRGALNIAAEFSWESSVTAFERALEKATDGS